MSRHRIVLCAALLSACVHALAQTGELGLTGGVSYYIGDINPYRHYPNHTHFAAGILYRYNFNERYALRLQGLYTTLEAYDSDSDDTLQVQRNLGFRTSLFEASALLTTFSLPRS